MRGNYMKGYRLGISTTFSIIVFFPKHWTGPSEWHLVTPCWHECGSTNQSPINIETQNTEYMPQTVLHFVNLCTRVPGKIRNNGKL